MGQVRRRPLGSRRSESCFWRWCRSSCTVARHWSPIFLICLTSDSLKKYNLIMKTHLSLSYHCNTIWLTTASRSSHKWPNSEGTESSFSLSLNETMMLIETHFTHFQYENYQTFTLTLAILLIIDFPLLFSTLHFCIKLWRSTARSANLSTASESRTLPRPATGLNASINHKSTFPWITLSQSIIHLGNKQFNYIISISHIIEQKHPIDTMPHSQLHTPWTQWQNLIKYQLNLHET